MPDLGGLPALDVAIGLIFVYFIFSLITSGINELLASFVGLRARYLEQGLRSMLAEPGKATKEVDDFVAGIAGHPLVSSLVKKPPKWKLPWRRALPSYMPSRTFALTLLDTFAPPVIAKTDDTKQQEDGEKKDEEKKDEEKKDEEKKDEEKKDEEQKEGEQAEASHDVIARLRKELAGLDTGAAPSLPAQAQRALLGMLDNARGDVDNLREQLETWFDDTMDRVSGWYKRRVTVILFVISLAVVGAFNVDSFQIGNKLLNDETIRTAVAAQAQRATQATTPEDAKEKLDAAGKNVVDLQALQLPIGWISEPATRPAGAKADPREWPGLWDLSAAKLGGLLITALALSLGAPFWFDLLNRVVRLRNAGVPEGGPRERRPRRERPETEAPTRAGGAPGLPRPPDNAPQGGDPGVVGG